ncbi:MAG: hypothetical protein WBK28_03325, partial [Minisyncoccia bacterium]
RGPQALTAKLCDRLHNLRTLGCCTKEKQQRTVKETQNFHLLMLIPGLAVHGELGASYASLLKMKIETAIASLP